MINRSKSEVKKQLIFFSGLPGRDGCNGTKVRKIKSNYILL